MRRHRAGTLALVTVLVTLVVLTVLGDQQATGALHPQNPDPEGARAVARVLDQQGIEVTVALDQDELLDAAVDRETTVLVTSMEELGSSTVRTLEETARRAGTVVLVAPPDSLVRQLSGGLRLASVTSGRLDAECTEPLLAGLEIEVGQSEAYSAPGSTRCFPAGNDSGVVVGLRVLPRRYVMGAPALLANDTVTDGDNAAVALRLLGQQRRLVWYVPTSSDLSAGEGMSVGALLPDWLRPGTLLLVAAGLAFVLWRGRRLGPVVVEPLPVVVRSSETVEARGRLYHKARDREHAGQVLRAATRQRLAHQLALGRAADPGLVVREVARLTGRDPGDLDALLAAGRISDDASLLRLATDLTDLENEVINHESGDA